MRRTLLILALSAVLPFSPARASADLTIPEDTRLFTNAPSAGGVSISPEDGKIEPFASFSITFPSDIVGADKIDMENADSPVVAWPPLDAKFYWRSTASGDWLVTGPRIPGQTYRLRLREGLTARDGSPLPTQDWGVELQSPPLTVSTWYGERSQLNSRPLVPLEFNYLVRISDIAEGIWFQDRATRKRFPAQINVDSSEDPQHPANLSATPRDPLPVGATYDLVVEGVHDAYAGRTLPYPRVFPLGTTVPLAVDYVAARNWATDKPHIEVKFKTNLSLDALPANAVSVDPPVPDLTLRKEGAAIYLDGTFDTTSRYKVTISKSVTGDRGFGLAADSTWGATFPAKPPTILFPPGEFRQRSALGLRFALIQSNTGPLSWRLASVPPDKLAAVLKATNSGFKDGEPLLIDALALPVLASGEFGEVRSGKEELRKLEAQPAGLSGPCLIEAHAKADDGSTIANRSLIWFSEVALTQKLTPDTLVIRAAGMGQGLPVPGLTIRLLTSELLEIASATTDASGIASFPRALSSAATFLETDDSGHITISRAAPDAQFPSGSSYFTPPPSVLGQTLTDRPLYRPGQELRIKGFVREKKDGILKVPTSTTIRWEISKAWQDDVLTKGSAPLSASGGWSAKWTVPEGVDLGEFRVRAWVGDTEISNPALFKIEEFRNPPFSVLCEAVAPDRPAVSTITVSSNYFHGAPNVGARVKWKAVWFSDHSGDYYDDGTGSGFNQVDLYSQNAKAPVSDKTAEGEASLDSDGRVTLTSVQPFPDASNCADSTVIWQVDVSGPEGQTITGGLMETVRMNDVTLGIKTLESRAQDAVHFELRTLPRLPGGKVPEKIPVTLFLVQTKSAKEQIAPFVYRYRNSDEFTKVATKEFPNEGAFEFPVSTPGRYVAVAGPVPNGIAVSAEQIITGPGEAELPVTSDESLSVTGPKEPVPIGQNASFDVLAPTSGVAWVTVETDRVLESRTVDLQGNASRIELTTKPEFIPNATVSVYLLRPGGSDALPGEMFGYTELNVSDPSATLSVVPTTTQPSVEPRGKVTGTVAVTNGGLPVPNAEVTVYAVDDSILELGGWRLPDIQSPFFPRNPFCVITSPALRGLISGFDAAQLTQKGYTVGDGGDEALGNVGFIRKNFQPLLFWNPDLKTDSAGNVTFVTEASDSLTRFRVIAFAQTAKGQFGAGSSTFDVSKRLLIEPALPRFLRQGDQIDLRAVARQKFSDSCSLAIRCVTSLSLDGSGSTDVTAAREAPAVVSFSAGVPDSATSATIRFEATATTGEKAADAVEVTLPILPKTISVAESVAGAWSGKDFRAADFTPPSWLQSTGSLDTFLSTEPAFAQLTGIPAILDYPHGCLEQQSARILALTSLADLLKWLPTDSVRDENYRRSMMDSFRTIEASLLPDGLLPYWPMGTEGNPFVTIQTALACSAAESAGLEVPERLASELPATLRAMASRSIKVSPTLRAFALYVLARSGVDGGADDLYLERDKLTYDGRALLSLAYAALGKDPEKQHDLVRNFPESFDDIPFDARSFSSTARTKALCLLARFQANPSADNLLRELQDFTPSSLSTQENLWLLFAFKEALRGRKFQPLAKSLKPGPAATSPNKTAAKWSSPLPTAPSISGLSPQSRGTFLMQAHRQLTPSETQPVAKGIRLDRMIKNLTDPSRTGTADAPFRLGDELLITYRFQPDAAAHFLALEDPLPAGVEVLNPSLDLFGKTLSLPNDPGVTTAALSHSELHDDKTNLYFDDVARGVNSYSVLARATAAGRFEWPPAQISPMYDARIHARTAPSRCVIAE